MIKNSIFSVLFFTGIILISIIFLPSLFLPQKVVLLGGKFMGHWASFCVKFFLSSKIIIKGKENLINNEKFFIAASHQSMFETFYLQTIFKSPVFILKKELLMIPIFGWYLKKIGSISIRRNKVTKDNFGFFDDISKIINNSNRPIVIFPQGTRVLPEINCQPVAINAGYVWPKKGLKQGHKTITISILKPITAEYSKEEFLKILERNIYSELNLLN